MRGSFEGWGHPHTKRAVLHVNRPERGAEVTADRGVRRVGDDALSGSALTMAQAFRNAVQRFGLSITEASTLCSATPAAVLGERRKGHLAAGMDADLVLLDAELNVRATVVGGILGRQSS